MPPTGTGTLARVVKERFGAEVVARVRTVTVGTSQVSLLPTDPERLFWLIVNRGAQMVDVWYESGLALGQGIPLAPNAWLSALWEEDGELVGVPLYGISGAAGQNLYVVEVRGQ